VDLGYSTAWHTRKKDASREGLMKKGKDSSEKYKEDHLDVQGDASILFHGSQTDKYKSEGKNRVDAEGRGSGAKGKQTEKVSHPSRRGCEVRNAELGGNMGKKKGDGNQGKRGGV